MFSIFNCFVRYILLCGHQKLSHRLFAGRLRHRTSHNARPHRRDIDDENLGVHVLRNCHNVLDASRQPIAQHKTNERTRSHRVPPPNIGHILKPVHTLNRTIPANQTYTHVSPKKNTHTNMWTALNMLIVSYNTHSPTHKSPSISCHSSVALSTL